MYKACPSRTSQLALLLNCRIEGRFTTRMLSSYATLVGVLLYFRQTQGVAMEAGSRFTRVQLDNWRNFVHADVPLQDRVFLVGPNASGKSNFLDALRFLRDLVSVGGGFQEAIRKRRGVSSIRCYAARRYPEVKLTVSVGTEERLNAWSYEIGFSQDNNQRPEITRSGSRRRTSSY
jgi:AAA domain, putative AbiEii toxin, Type IV TA system